MEEVEVLVVGAGPAGSTAAYELARRGHDVRVLEEHPRVGRPVQCAGLVSDRVLELAGGRSFVRRSVRGASVFSPSLRSISFAASDHRAHVIDRAALDVHLADRAAGAGARFETSTKFDGIEGSSHGGVRCRLTRDGTRGEEVLARLVIGADGVASAVARALRLRRPVEILPAFEAEFPDVPSNPDEVEVYLGREFAPGLFGWSIPDGAGGARVGVAAEADGVPAQKRFERLLDRLERRHGRRPRNATQFIASGIPIGLVPRAVAGRGMLVGDAAAQVKPLSGGGIFTGMRSAQLLAEVAHRALAEDDLRGTRLAEYDRAWRSELGGEFEKALYLRRLFCRLTDADFEQVVAALEGTEMAASIVAFGDIDFPSHVARRLLRQSPSLFRLFPKALGALWGGESRRAPALDFGPRPNA